MAVCADQPALVFRRRTVYSKVTDDEYAAFEALALARNKTVSDWVRDTLLTVAIQESAEHTLLAELFALRKILLNLHFTRWSRGNRSRMNAWWGGSTRPMPTRMRRRAPG
jgi:hypothetical protein